MLENEARETKHRIKKAQRTRQIDPLPVLYCRTSTQPEAVPETIPPAFPHPYMEKTAAENRSLIMAQSEKRVDYLVCQQPGRWIGGEIAGYRFSQRHLQNGRRQNARHQHHTMNTQAARALQ